MGRIVTHVRIRNLLEQGKAISCDALVDTGAAYLVLPKPWRGRLGNLTTVREIDCETATQRLPRGASPGCARRPVDAADHP